MKALEIRHAWRYALTEGVPALSQLVQDRDFSFTAYLLKHKPGLFGSGHLGGALAYALGKKAGECVRLIRSHAAAVDISPAVIRSCIANAAEAVDKETVRELMQFPQVVMLAKADWRLILSRAKTKIDGEMTLMIEAAMQKAPDIRPVVSSLRPRENKAGVKPAERN